MPRREITPHPTHRMSEWQSGIVGLHGDRFGSETECSRCGEAEWRHAGGSSLNYHLERPCFAAEPVERRGPLSRYEGDERWWLGGTFVRSWAEWEDFAREVLACEASPPSAEPTDA